MSEPANEVVEEVEEAGARLRLVRSASGLAVFRGADRLFGEQRRREDRAFADFVTAPITGRDDLRVTLVGLGSGHLLRALLDIPGVREAEVIEQSPTIASWARSHFAVGTGGALSDPRVNLRIGALQDVLDGADAPTGRFAVVLDIDSSLAAPITPELYQPAGLARCIEMLRPGGVLALASTRRETAFLRELSTRMQNVAEVAAPVDSEPGALDYFYRARRPAAGGAPRGRN